MRRGDEPPSPPQSARVPRVAKLMALAIRFDQLIRDGVVADQVELARLGYVCLIYDPIGQGERIQYVTDDLSPRIGTGTREHLHAGNQQFLVGEFFGMWRAWDGIRALDYLLERGDA